MTSKSIPLILGALLAMTACDDVERRKPKDEKAAKAPAPSASTMKVTQEAAGRCVQLNSVSHWAKNLGKSEAEAATYAINLWAEPSDVSPRKKVATAHPGDSLPLLASTTDDYQVDVAGTAAWISMVQAEAVVDCK